LKTIPKDPDGNFLGTLEPKNNNKKDPVGFLYFFTLHSKQCWVVLTQNWEKYGQPKCWVKNVI